MGYDLHITRRKDWADKGNDITTEEWLTYAQNDPELRPDKKNPDLPYMFVWSGRSSHAEPWLDWYDGNIYSKNPDQPLINKMIAVAKTLNAAVQGDDGEPYHDTPKASSPPKASLVRRLLGWLSPSHLAKRSTADPASLPFKIGDKVIDTFGNNLTVISIDPTAERGTGVIRTRNSEGAIVGHAMIAYDLKLISPKKAILENP